MADEYLIGIDIGTSGCKLILIDDRGNIIGGNGIYQECTRPKKP